MGFRSSFIGCKLTAAVRAVNVSVLRSAFRLDFAARIGYKVLMSNLHRLLSLALVAVLLFTGCNNAWVRRAARAAGEEAAYVALEGYLNKAGITSAGLCRRRGRIWGRAGRA